MELKEKDAWLSMVLLAHSLLTPLSSLWLLEKAVVYYTVPGREA